MLTKFKISFSFEISDCVNLKVGVNKMELTCRIGDFFIDLHEMCWYVSIYANLLHCFLSEDSNGFVIFLRMFIT